MLRDESFVVFFEVMAACESAGVCVRWCQVSAVAGITLSGRLVKTSTVSSHSKTEQHGT